MGPPQLFFYFISDGDDDDDVAIVQGPRATRRADSGDTAQLFGWGDGGMGRTVYTQGAGLRFFCLLTVYTHSF